MRKEELPAGDIYERICNLAVTAGIQLSTAELATVVANAEMGEKGLASIEGIFSYLAQRHRDEVVSMMLKLSRLPQRDPKEFKNFDFNRIQGRDASALRNLPALADLYARKNIAFIGPSGIGKTHLAQAYGRECCRLGHRTYYIKATELKAKFENAVKSGSTARCVTNLVMPACLIVDEVGRCVFDTACTQLFFDVIDRRYEKDGPNTLIVTSNVSVVNWNDFFTGDETLACALDRIFDKASVFVMKGASFRGSGCETYSVEAMSQAVKQVK